MSSPDPSAEPSRWWLAYEATMAVLALVVVWLLTVPEDAWTRAVNLAIWAVFVADYATRLTLADDRRRFVRSNVPELIAILPLDFLRVARLARLARLVRLMRAGTVLWRVTRDVRGIVTTNGLGYVLLVASGVVLVGGYAAWAAEEDLGSFGDGVWWALVTAATVGYGDIAPATASGRAVATVLMLVGIGTLGMITGSIATYFLGDQGHDAANPQIDWLCAQLRRWNALEQDERRRLAAMLAGLAALDDVDDDRHGRPQDGQADSVRGFESRPSRGAGDRREAAGNHTGDR